MLGDLIDVKIDAKQVLDTLNNEASIANFKKSIYVPEPHLIEQLIDGTRYFITGTKGVGKTAFLIYTALQAEEKFNAERSFIIFKEFSQEEREDYNRLAYVTNYEQDRISPYYDYLMVWNWMFHVAVYEAIKNSDKVIFNHDENWIQYCEAIDAVKSNVRGVNRRLPIIAKGGFVELNLNICHGKINFEFDSSDKNMVRFSTHINYLNQLYINLSAADSKLFIVVDELNLSTKNSAEFDRDICMIRDMITAIERFNTLSKHGHDQVRIIGAVRSEVINSVQIRGQEINKSIESYGIPIDWNKYYIEGIRHPLIRLMIKYFRLSESNRQVNGSEDEAVYSRWVEPSIHGFSSDQYIRNHTLYRPRDIIRLLNLFRLNCFEYKKISSQAFNVIMRQYSNDCWNESLEELAISYSFTELDAIQTWLTGCNRITSYDELKKRATLQWSEQNASSSLLNNFDKLLQNLYKAGILGNYIHLADGTNIVHHRWYFRGDDTLLFNQKIEIHPIYSAKLSIYE